MASRTLLRVSIASVIALGGCHLIGGVDDLDFDGDLSASGAGGPGAGGNAGGGDVGGSGGEGACGSCGECAPCEVDSCVPVDAGTACTGGVCDGTGVCAMGSPQWSRRFGSIDADAVRGVAAGDADTVTIAGTFEGSPFTLPGIFDLHGSGQTNAFVAQLDAATGDGLRGFVFGNSTNASVEAVRAGSAAGAIFVAGNYGGGGLKVGDFPPTTPANGGFVAALHENAGALEADWVLAVSAPQVAVHDIAAAPLDTIAVVGVAGATFDSNLDVSIGTAQPQTVTLESARATGFVAVVQQAGNGAPAHVWSEVMRHFANIGNAESATRAASFGVDGSLWIVGDYRGLWYVPKGGQSALLDDQGTRAGFIAKYGPGSNPSVSCHAAFRSQSSNDEDHFIHAVAATPDGGAVIVGTFEDRITLAPGEDVLVNQDFVSDLIIAKLDTCTDLAWHYRIPNASSTGRNPSVAIDADGNVIVAAAFSQPVVLGDDNLDPGTTTDTFVAKLAGTNGALLWHAASKVSGIEAALGVAASPTGSVIIGGATENQIFGSVDDIGGGIEAFVTSFGP